MKQLQGSNWTGKSGKPGKIKWPGNFFVKSKMSGNFNITKLIVMEFYYFLSAGKS